MEVRCANCGARIPLQRDDALLRCPFCDSTLYLDRAHTFVRLLLPPLLNEAQARRRFAEELTRKEIPEQKVLEAKGLLLPFWGRRGGESVRAEAAFAPLPVALVEYELPSAGATVSPDEPPPGFARLPCSENSAARWEKEQGQGAGLVLYEAPVFHVAYGSAQKPFEAYVDAISGAVFMAESPSAMTDAISRGSMKALIWLFLIFALEAIVIPNAALSLVAAVITGVAAFPVLKKRIAQPPVHTGIPTQRIGP